METTKNISINKWMRVAHRDIGFFVIGLTIIYCISGIMLTYRDTGFLRGETFIEKNLEPGLRFEQLARVLHLRNTKLIDQDDQIIAFSSGSYNKETGVATYMSEEIPGVLRVLNGLHKVPSKDDRSLFTVFYACMLLFLAVSSFWMYRPGTRLFKRGIITALAGMTISVLLVVI